MAVENGETKKKGNTKKKTKMERRSEEKKDTIEGRRRGRS
jgi:hypothetical protein